MLVVWDTDVAATMVRQLNHRVWLLAAGAKWVYRYKHSVYICVCIDSMYGFMCVCMYVCMYV